jgi:methylmalonyl-CoA mutase
MSEQKKLFDNFPPVSTKEWIDRITADLKGEDFSKKMIWKTAEGFSLMPFYRAEDIENLPFINSLPGQAPFIRGGSASGNHWLIRQNIEVQDYGAANSKALDILMKGVDSVGFIIKNPESVTSQAIENLLEGIHPESIEISFICEGKAKETVRSFLMAIEKSDINKENITGAFEADPLGRLFLKGKLCISLEAGLDYLADLARESLPLPSFRTIQVNGQWLSEAGADIIAELAFALSMGNEYMSVLTEKGISADDAASRIGFCFATGSNYFFEIAKLRAARMLWSEIAGRYNPLKVKNTRMRIQSVTSERNKSADDPYLNLLRTQTEAMSAVIGGADTISVGPFDKTFRKPGEFSERLARNQQLLLREEAYFDKVADPAGGSWYIEKLTSLIADEAWKLFIATEEQGGFVEALKNGYVRSRIDRPSEQGVK